MLVMYTRRGDGPQIGEEQKLLGALLIVLEGNPQAHIEYHTTKRPIVKERHWLCAVCRSKHVEG